MRCVVTRKSGYIYIYPKGRSVKRKVSRILSDKGLTPDYHAVLPEDDAVDLIGEYRLYQINTGEDVVMLFPAHKYFGLLDDSVEDLHILLR
jgi:hypothetical protein